MVRIQFALLVGTSAWDLPDEHREHGEHSDGYWYQYDYYGPQKDHTHHEHHEHHGHKHDRHEHRGPHPGKEKFQPLVDACEGLDVNTSCSSTLTGTCKADEDDGKMYCAHECPGKPHEEHSSRPPWSKGGHGPKQEGNCGNKSAGDSCSVQKEGICVSSGKCPIFQGKVVCKANDAHPPSFVTEPCNDKAEGDECQTWHGPGKCHKFFEDFVCKPDWEHSGHGAHRVPHQDHEHYEQGEHPDYDYYYDYYGSHDGDTHHEHHEHHGHKHDRPEHRGPHPGKEKFQPLVDACQGLDVNHSCSSTLTGMCKADEDDGKMYCAHERPRKPHEEHSSRPPWSTGGHGPKQEGNCGNKSAGDSCFVRKEGICVSSGKCPIFQGSVVCKANGAHPPSFVTEPCNDKAEGDECQTWHGPGKCHKFFEDFVCKPDWEHSGHGAHHGPNEDHEHHKHRGHQHDYPGHSERGEHGEHRGHEHTQERPSPKDARLRQPYQSAAFGSGGKSGEAPSFWMAERLQWLSGVPTWWSDDGNAHWTSVAV